MASITLPFTLGIIGGGQLARMTAIAAAQMGLQVSVLHPSQDCPAAAASEIVVGAWTKREDLQRWGQTVDAITLEHEFVAAADLDWLAQQGMQVWPTGTTLALIQDKWRQRSHLQQAGLPVPRFRAIEFLTQLKAVQQEWGGAVGGENPPLGVRRPRYCHCPQTG